VRGPPRLGSACDLRKYPRTLKARCLLPEALKEERDIAGQAAHAAPPSSVQETTGDRQNSTAQLLGSGQPPRVIRTHETYSENLVAQPIVAGQSRNFMIIWVEHMYRPEEIHLVRDVRFFQCWQCWKEHRNAPHGPRNAGERMRFSVSVSAGPRPTEDVADPRWKNTPEWLTRSFGRFRG
jgi:hypothetical protein